ncbi:uncharacterized protein LOC129883625 [Solanum dulcamara]|uniref:uncharacterized protein LOC129883625 n=1 Tax=Solanum dulcamara TaxID=45834 RepID=UPI002485B1E5|nr:uncharacterized protein LOC129883625 [Solanum dulcamara]
MGSSHLYYLHSSDFPGMNLVNFTFDGKGYGGWRRSVLIALSAKNKIDFIDGTCKEPAIDSTNHKLWSRCNDIVLSWLLNSLSKEISDSVIYSKTTKALWTDLEERFDQSNGAKLYHLQKELSDLVQGSNDIATYFTKLKKLWDELDTLNADINCGCNYSCGGKDKLTKSIQDERLMHFLMGLNDSYASFRGNMLIISPLPNVNVAYSILIQDEKQRKVYVNQQYPSESSSCLSINQHKYTPYDQPIQKISNYDQYNQKYGNYEQKGKGKFDTRKNNLTCSHCKKPGHSIDKCYRIVGNNQQFSQEQFSQLVHLLQQVKVSQSGHTSSEAEAVANSVACSGATQHMAFDTSIFFNLTPLLTPLSINLPNSQKTLSAI